MNDIETLIQKVKHKRVDELSSETLIQLQEDETLIALLKILHDDDYFVRADASWALQLVGKPAIPGLIDALRDENWHVRQVAAETLGWIGDPIAVSNLIVAISDTDHMVFEQAVYALADIARENDVPKLYPLLNSDNPRLRLAAAYALEEKAGEAGIQGFVDLARYRISGDKHEHETAVNGIVSIGSVSIPALIPLLRDDDDMMRRFAIECLGKIGDPIAVINLIDALKHEPEDYIREEIGWALTGMGDAGFQHLLQALQDPDQRLRQEVIRPLGEFRDSAAVPELVRALRESNDSYIRGQIIFALGRIGNPTVIPILLDYLEDKTLWFSDRHVDDVTAQVLRHDFGTPEALAAVEEWRRKQQK
ncbi:MAG: HEAT repeat domain-containing protein [Chloroflexota bacterium]